MAEDYSRDLNDTTLTPGLFPSVLKSVLHFSYNTFDVNRIKIKAYEKI